jgi:hypothetical protein
MRRPELKLAAAVLLFFSLNSKAQGFKFPFTNNDLRTSLSKVITDYVDGFASLKGDTISVSPQSIEFTSKLNFQGGEENTITQYKSKNQIYSWQAVLLTSEDFDQASKKYKWLCNQLKVMTVKVQEYSFTMSGDYEAPDDLKKFVTSIFKLTPNASNMPRLKIEATMQFEFPEWKVHLRVYEREREDNERGDIYSD